MWEAAQASGAAPTYFGAYGHFLDGGLIANNPSLDCLTEIHEYNLALEATGRKSEVAPITALVSLGTGNIPTSEVCLRIDCLRLFTTCSKKNLIFFTLLWNLSV